MIGVRERRMSSAWRLQEEQRHAVREIRRATNMKITVIDSKRYNMVAIRKR